MKKLEYKVIHEGVDFTKEANFLDAILESNGVENIDAFLNVNKDDVHNPFLMKNMKVGVELLHGVLELDEPHINVCTDVDVDGETSASTIIQFIKTIKPNAKVTYSLDYNKRHGLYVDRIGGSPDLIIVPDASVGDEETGEYIKENNLKVLVLDHHNYQEWQNNYSTYITCTDGQYPNPHLSGVGVVQKFIEAYVSTYNLDESLKTKWLDLVALGQVADSVDLRSLETRYYTLEGLKPENRNNLLINEMMMANVEDAENNWNIHSMAWNISPLINSTIRYGKESEQIDLFRAICGEQEDREYHPRRKSKFDPKPPAEIHSLQKTMARVCKNVKARQDKEVNECFKKLKESINKQQLYKNSIIAINGTDILKKKTLTGLIANKLTSEYKRPVLVLKAKDDETYGGSGRNYDKGNVENLSDLLNDTGLIECMGHYSAFGLIVKKENLNKLVSEFNKKVPLNTLTTIHTVDYEIDANDLREQDVLCVAEKKDIWSKGVEEPTFAITDIHIKANEITENGGFIRFRYNGITYIKKYCPRGEYETMTLADRCTIGENKKDLKITLIGQFQSNEWEGKVYPQVKILYYYAEEDKKKVEEKIPDFFDDVLF